jgi:hypothetical protein
LNIAGDEGHEVGEHPSQWELALRDQFRVILQTSGSSNIDNAINQLIDAVKGVKAAIINEVLPASQQPSPAHAPALLSPRANVVPVEPGSNVHPLPLRRVQPAIGPSGERAPSEADGEGAERSITPPGTPQRDSASSPSSSSSDVDKYFGTDAS